MILATNVAETSLTIPGIVYVVDAGLARLSRYEPRTGTTRLQIEGISQASADQRKGRCGRVRDGICIRLYDESSFAARPAFTDPEMKRTGLAGVILRMKALGLGDVEDVSLPRSAQRPLDRRGLPRAAKSSEPSTMSERSRSSARRLANFPGRLSHRAYGRWRAPSYGCLRGAFWSLASGLNVQDLRERPRGRRAKSRSGASGAFATSGSDFVGILKLWDFIREHESRGSCSCVALAKKTFCRSCACASGREVHRQLQDLVKRASSEARPSRSRPAWKTARRFDRALLRVDFCRASGNGIPSNVFTLALGKRASRCIRRRAWPKSRRLG
ncbi:MAG: helicase-related protein [Mesorhizobium sp.]